MLHRGQHHIGLDAEHFRGDFRKLAGEILVDLPIGPGFPRRVHRRRQRVDERVHVGCVEVVLFVPGGRRQHDVGVDAGGGHAEIQRHQQVEFSLRRLVMPRDFLRLLTAFDAEIAAEHAVAGAEQMLEEILMTLAGRAQQIGTPDEHVARPVGGIIGVVAGQFQFARADRLGDVIRSIQPGRLGTGRDAQRVLLQLRGGRQPAHALGAHVVVDRAAAPIAIGCCWRQDV